MVNIAEDIVIPGIEIPPKKTFNIRYGNSQSHCLLASDGGAAGYFLTLGNNSCSVTVSSRNLTLRTKDYIDICNTANTVNKARVSFSMGATGPALKLEVDNNDMIITSDTLDTGSRGIRASKIGKDQYTECTLPASSGTLARMEDLNALSKYSFSYSGYILYIEEK